MHRETDILTEIPKKICRFELTDSRLYDIMRVGPPTWILGQASGITYYAMALKIHNRSLKIFVYL